MSIETLNSLFGYKSWANSELFSLLATLRHPEHSEQLHTCIRTLDPHLCRGQNLSRPPEWGAETCSTLRTRRLPHRSSSFEPMSKPRMPGTETTLPTSRLQPCRRFWPSLSPTETEVGCRGRKSFSTFSPTAGITGVTSAKYSDRSLSRHPVICTPSFCIRPSRPEGGLDSTSKCNAS